MDNKKEFPKRKPTRLSFFDYGTSGAYFITVCTESRKKLLSEIIKTPHPLSSVGEGLAPPEYTCKLTPCGEIAKDQLLALETRFPFVSVEDYIIMPDHIHAIIFLHENAGGASPSPTLCDIVCAFKSLSARICKQRYGVEKLYQRSFAEHIIRDKNDYETRKKYICENPLRWHYKHLNTESWKDL